MMNRRTRERLICTPCARGCVLGCSAGGAAQADVSTSNCADERLETKPTISQDDKTPVEMQHRDHFVFLCVNACKVGCW